MSAIDTQKVAHKLQTGGFSKTQALAAADVLAELLDDRPTRDAVYEAVQEAVVGLDQRRQADTALIRADIAQQGVILGQHGGAIANQGEAIAKQGEAIANQGEAIAKQGEAIAKQGEAIANQGEAIANQGEAIANQGVILGQHGEAIARLEGLMVKLLEGQAILLQNDMELKRRLEGR